MARLGFFLALGVLAVSAGSALAYPDQAAGIVALTVQPKVVRIHPAGRYLYVADSTSAAISVVDTLFFKETRRITLGGLPRDLALSIDGSVLFIVTAQSDRVERLDLADPAVPVILKSFVVGTSGVTFDRVAVAGSSGAEILPLLSFSKKALYAWDVKNEALIGGGDPIALGYTPVDGALGSERRRYVILGEGGEIRSYLPVSLSTVGNALNLDDYTPSKAFRSLSLGKLSLGDYAFVTNALDPGELFFVNMVSTTTYSASVVSADPGSGTAVPAAVGAEPSAAITAQVNRSLADATASALYLYVANGGDSTLSVLNTAGIGGTSVVEPIATISDVPNVPAGGLAVSGPDEGYLYAADASGSRVTVVTDQPFLTLVASPTGPVDTANAGFTVRSDLSGTLTVLLYSGKTTDAVSLSSGTTLQTLSIDADTDTSISIPAASLEEGENTIAFFVANGKRLGRGAGTVTKQTPPPVPKGFKLSFGNRKIIARWDRVSRSDVTEYRVYFGTASDASGGVPDLTSPQEVVQPGSGEVKYVIEPVENGTTVYAYVTAVSDAGKEGAPTEILSETAEATVGILDFSNETGGCRTSVPGFSGLLILLILSILTLIKYFNKCSHSIVIIVFIMLIPALSSASERPMTSMEFRVGWWVPADPVLKRFLGKAGNELYSLRFGILWGPVDIGVESGLLTETSALLGATSGRTSGEFQRVTLVPTEFSAQYNLRIGAAPLLVPFGRVGYDLTYFRVSQPERSESGAKHQIALTGGLRLNLERLTGSNDMEDLLGIRHFFLQGFATWRQQFGKGLDFGGWTFGPGLGVEF